MPLETVARRYAEALYEAAREEHLEERIGAELARLRQLWLDIPELGLFLSHPEVPQEAKEQLARSLTAGMHPYLGNLLILLVRKGRAGLLPAIGREYLNAAEEAGKLVHVVMRTAREVGEEELRELRRALEAALGKPVAISVEEAPELLAGAELSVRGQRIDASVAGRLARLAAGLRG